MERSDRHSSDRHSSDRHNIADFWESYKRNARGVVFSGYKFSKDMLLDDGYLGPQIVGVLSFFGHTATLPLTATVGAAIKTAVDIDTREIIPSNQMHELIQNISELHNDDLASLVSDITDYSARSKSSQELKENLSGAEKGAKLAIEEVERQNPMNRAVAFLAEETPLDAQPSKEKMRADQKAFILTYMYANHNKGKKMQHVIKDSVDRLMGARSTMMQEF